MCTGDLRIRRNPGRSDAPDRTTTNPRPNFCVWPLANDALINPHDRKAGREGRPIFRSTRSSPAMCVSPSMRIPPLRCPALRVGRFSALNKRPFPSRIFLLPKSQAHKKGITLDRFSPDQSRKEKNAYCLAVPFKVISRVPRQKRVKIDRQNFPKSFPGKRFLEREQRVEARREEGVPQFSG